MSTKLKLFFNNISNLAYCQGSKFLGQYSYCPQGFYIRIFKVELASAESRRETLGRENFYLRIISLGINVTYLQALEFFFGGRTRCLLFVAPICLKTPRWRPISERNGFSVMKPQNRRQTIFRKKNKVRSQVLKFAFWGTVSSKQSLKSFLIFSVLVLHFH